MKKGTFIIIEIEGHFIAAIRRADGIVTQLPEVMVTSDLKNLDDRPCEYLLKGDKIVVVDGRNVFKQQKLEKSSPKQPEKQVNRNWKRDIYTDTTIDKPEVVDNLEKPGWSNHESFSLKDARVPSDTRKVSVPANQVDNFYLKLNQFARFEISKNKKNELERKFLFMKGRSYQIQALFGNLFNKDSQLADRLMSTAKSIFPKDGALILARFKPEWRFVTGLGGHSVYETGITLHHIYGIPYIPASTIKGVLRSWIIFSQFDNNEKNAFNDATFCYLFGCPAESVLKKTHKGKVVFFDALPTRTPKIEPDIMNPHFPDYYGAKLAPTDTQNPIPVLFLTVVKTPFQFLMASKEWNLNTELFWNKTSTEWLNEALSEKGIGAKTSVGYGYMKQLS